MPRYPKGYSDKPGHTKIAVSLTNATFKRLVARAKDEEKQFSEIVEDVVKCGLLCLDESDAEENPHVKPGRPEHTPIRG